MPKQSPPPKRPPAASYIVPIRDPLTTSTDDNDEDSETADDKGTVETEPDDETINADDCDETTTVEADESLTDISTEDFNGVSIPGAVTTETSENADVKEDSPSNESVMTDTGTNSSIDSKNEADVTVESSIEEPTSNETGEVDLDFGGVDIEGAAENTPSEENVDASPAPDTSSESNVDDEVCPDDDVDLTKPPDFSTEDATDVESVFTDPDASETWGSAEATGFEHATTVETDAVEDDHPSSEVDSVVPVPIEQDRETEPDADKFDIHGDDNVDLDFGGVDIDGAAENDGEPDDEFDIHGDSNVDLDFDGVDIDGATDDETTDTGFDRTETKSRKESSPTGDSSNTTSASSTESVATAAEVSGDQSTVDEESTDAEEGEQRIPRNDPATATATATEAPPAVENPGTRIRSPSEIIGRPLYTAFGVVSAIVLGLLAVSVLALRGVTILAEWGASILLIFYGIVVGMALIFPASAIGVSGFWSRLALIGELSIVVIPGVIAVFALSALVDRLFFEGNRHTSPPVFQRL